MAFAFLGTLAFGCATAVQQESTEQTSEAVAPLSGCLTEALCPTGSCSSGITPFTPPEQPGPHTMLHFPDVTWYGTALCPNAWVLEMVRPWTYTVPGYATVSVTPSEEFPLGQADCNAASAVSVVVYKHTAAGWNPAPWLATPAIPLWNGTSCVFNILQNLGGATSDVDTLRIVLGGRMASGADVPIDVNVVECAPATTAACTSGGVSYCGPIADGCGGIVQCPACPPNPVCKKGTHWCGPGPDEGCRAVCP